MLALITFNVFKTIGHRPNRSDPGVFECETCFKVKLLENHELEFHNGSRLQISDIFLKVVNFVAKSSFAFVLDVSTTQISSPENNKIE